MTALRMLLPSEIRKNTGTKEPRSATKVKMRNVALNFFFIQHRWKIERTLNYSRTREDSASCMLGTVVH